MRLAPDVFSLIVSHFPVYLAVDILARAFEGDVSLFGNGASNLVRVYNWQEGIGTRNFM